MPHIEFLADGTEGGDTIASVLRTRFRLTWTQAKRLIENGHVRVAGFACTDPAHRVRSKNRIWIREGVLSVPYRKVSLPTDAAKTKTPEKKGTKATAKKEAQPAKPAAKTPNKRESADVNKTPRTSTPIVGSPISASNIIYSDDSVVVVNKPAGLTTMRHAEEAAEFGPRGKKFLPKTLADWLPKTLGAPDRPVYAVHRIDRDTSGLVAFARTAAAAKHLTKQFRDHSADRRYLALTRGVPSSTRIESVLVLDRGDGRRGSAQAGAAVSDGKHAVTHVKVLETLGDFALVECRLETGRTHQVRIHLGEAGAPLCGEKVYDRPLNGRPKRDSSGATRPMLHAAQLGFKHPETGEAMTWDVEPPKDFRDLLGKLQPDES